MSGLARYRLTLEPWVSALRYRRDCRILQDKNAVEIAQAVFERYPRRRFDLRVGDAPGQVRSRLAASQNASQVNLSYRKCWRAEER